MHVPCSPSAPQAKPPAQSVRRMLSAVDELGSAPFCGRTPAKSSLRIRPSEREAIVVYVLPSRLPAASSRGSAIARCSFHRRADLKRDMLAVHRACASPAGSQHLVAAVSSDRPLPFAVAFAVRTHHHAMRKHRVVAAVQRSCP